METGRTLQGGSHLMTLNPQLTMAKWTAGTAITKQGSHLILCFMTASLNDGNFFF